MPCYHPVTKIALRPRNIFYPSQLTTLGDHIKQKRLDLKLEQKGVAKMIQVSKDTICLWENNRCQPGLRFYPAIMDFLGYCPWEHTQTWGERLNRYRIHQGLSLEQFAQELGVDPGILARQLKKNPSAYFKKKITEFQKRWRVSDCSASEPLSQSQRFC